ncbi:C-_U-editing enzyme APOBEC-1-like isoform X2 [Periplaneta americana]|uniref:C->U-editing enzyme APOBEC-1-like isoform X2 n=1 Tax=Periplaneta americana TaxID=6978 RepID=UPI0037E92167
MTAVQRRYVSFAGGGGRSRRNNAQTFYLIPPEDRQLFRSRWNEFYRNGRPIFRKSCVVMAKARFDDVDDTVWEFSKYNTGDHATVKALQQVQEKEQRYHTAQCVDLYLSYSPCTKCADVILQFSMSRPRCEFTVMFSCVFRGDDQVHRMGLRRLNASPDITLRVFTRRDWSVLAEATGSALKLSDPEREEWDLNWQNQLDFILSAYEYSRCIADETRTTVGQVMEVNPFQEGRIVALKIHLSWFSSSS